MGATLVGAVADLAAKDPGATAVLEKRFGIWVERSIGDLAADAGRLAAGLRAAGVGPGEVVGLIVSARLEWITLDLAIQAAGATTLALPAAVGHEDVARVLAETNVRTVVVEAQDQADVVLSAVETGSLPNLRSVVYIDPAGVSEYSSELLSSIEDLRGGTETRLATTADPGDTAALVPRASGLRDFSPVSHATLVLSARSTIEAASLTDRDRVIAVRTVADPVDRGATIYAALLAGAVLAIPENAATVDSAIHEIAPTYVHLTERWLATQAARITVRFDENRGLKARLASAWRRRTGSTLEKYGSAKPARGLWHFLITLPILEELGLEKARVAVVSGQPTPRSVAGFFTALGLPIHSALGVPELCGFAAMGAAGDVDGWVGSAMPGVEVSVESGTLQASTPATGTIDTGVAASESGDGYVAGVGTPEEAAATRLRSIPVIASAIVGDGASTLVLELDGTIASRWASNHRLDAATYRSFSTLPEMQEGVAALAAAVLERFGLTAGSIRMLPVPLHEVPDALDFGDVPRGDVVATID